MNVQKAIAAEGLHCESQSLFSTIKNSGRAAQLQSKNEYARVLKVLDMVKSCTDCG